MKKNPFHRFVRKSTINTIRFFRTSFHKFKTTEHAFIMLVAAGIGILAGFGAIGIHYAIEFFQHLFWGPHELSIDYYYNLPWWLMIVSPAIAGLLVGFIIHFFASEAKGHGVPEVMAAIALRNGVIRKRVAAAKLVASSLYIGGGGSVGREGPVIQIGSAIGSVFGQFFRVNTQRMKTFVACGAAAGIAAAFNAPIAGALFSLEIILSDFAVTKFSPIVVSAVLATVVSHTFLGDHTTFQVPEYELVSAFELIPYSLLGIFAGLVAYAFIQTLHRSEDFFDNINWPIYIKTMIGGIMIGGIGIFVPHIFGVGYDTMDSALRGNLGGWLLFGLIFAKIIATSISLGSGGSGGVFAPSLFLGTAAGGSFGVLMHNLFPTMTATPGAYALVGMGAVVAASTHAPLTAILIIFEMTNDYSIILPLMISVTIGTIFRGKLMRESIYTIKLAAKGIDIFGGRDVNVLRGAKVSSVIDNNFDLLPANTPFKEIMRKTIESPQRHLWVINEHKNFLGGISLANVRQILQEEEYLRDVVVAHDLIDTELPTITEESTLDIAMKMFGRFDIDLMPVVSSDGKNRIIGQLSLHDVVERYNNELYKADLTVELAHSVKQLKESRTIDFVDGYSLAEIQCPKQFLGKSLRSMHFRQTHQLQIILIKRNGESGKEEQAIVPTPNEILQEGDRLVVVGPDKKVEAVKNI